MAQERLTKRQTEETINQAGRSTYPEEKSVLRTEATRVNTYGLQLLSGDLVPIAKVSRRADVRRPHTVSPPPES